MARILGMIFRASDRKTTARFYAAMGLCAHEHQHGGPIHHEIGPMSENAVLEIYTASANFDADALMVEVDSIAVAVEVASTYGVEPPREVKEAADMRFVYIRDPDGRPLMLIENK